MRIHSGSRGGRARCLSFPMAWIIIAFAPDVESALPHLAGQFVIGFSGSMKPWHGLPNLIAAFESIKEQLPHAHLLLVGDGGELPAVRDALQQRGLLSAATLTGAVPSAQMPGLIAAMDVAVAPYPASTDFYFSPLKIVEYMAAGRAIVASRIGQICELLEQDRTALLCEAGESDSLANAILRMTNDSLRIRLGSAARIRAVERHTWDQVAAKIISFANERRVCGGVGLMARNTDITRIIPSLRATLARLWPYLKQQTPLITAGDCNAGFHGRHEAAGTVAAEVSGRHRFKPRRHQPCAGAAVCSHNGTCVADRPRRRRRLW